MLRHPMTRVLDPTPAENSVTTAYERSMDLPRALGSEHGRVWFEWTAGPDVMTPWGAVFGGYLAALTDHAAGRATVSVLEPHETFGTTDLRVSPLRPVREGVLVRIEGRILHRSRSAIHAEVEFRGEDDSLLAKGSAIQVVSRST